MLLLASDYHAQIGFGQEAHRRYGPVVEVGRLRREPLAGFVDEARVDRRPGHGVPQLLGGQSLQRVVEGERVHEDRPRDVGCVGRQALMLLRVDLFGQCPLSRPSGGDIVGDGGHESGLPEPGHDLLPDRLVAGIDVMEVNRRRISGPLLPKVGDGTREQPQHPAHSLEVGERGGLAGQRLHDVRVQRVACSELVHRLGPGGLVGKRILLARPQLAVGVDDLGRPGFVDVLEQAPPKHLHGLVLFSRIQERRLACGDALDLGHSVRDELVFRRVGVGRAPVLADGERVDEGRVRRGLDRLEQRGEERRQLARRVVEPANLPEIDRQLVEQDQRRLIAEQGTQRFRAGCYTLLVASAHSLVARLTREGVGDLAPRRVGQHPAAECSAIHGIGVLAVERGDTDGSDRQQPRIDELADVRHAGHPASGVCQCDQAVRLPAAVGRVEAEDRSDCVAGAAQAAAHVDQQVLQAPGRIGVGEERTGLPVVGARLAGQDLCEVGREVGVGYGAVEHVRPRTADVEDRRNRHASVLEA